MLMLGNHFEGDEPFADTDSSTRAGNPSQSVEKPAEFRDQIGWLNLLLGRIRIIAIVHVREKDLRR